MYTGDVLSCTSHSGTVRHTCPIKNGEGDGLFFTVRKDKTLYKPTRWRSEALGELPEGITRSIKGSEKERQETDASLIDNPQEPPVAIAGKLYPFRYSATNPDTRHFGSRIILWYANPVAVGTTFGGRQLFHSLCRNRRHSPFCLPWIDAGCVPPLFYQRVYKETDRRTGVLQNQPSAPASDRCGRLAARNQEIPFADRICSLAYRYHLEARKYVRFDAPGAYGGYYTQDDIREILEYARQHYITVIPEIEMPSHSEEVLAAYPQLSCSGEPYKNSDFCVGNEETFTFLENVLTEVMELFPSEYIHIGGDEAGKSAWKTCPKCQKRMTDEHLANVDELQSYLIHRIEKFLNNHGRHLLGWDEILQGGIAPNATVMSWRGEEGGIAAVTSGHRAIMTPGAYCYLDSYQDAPYSQPEAIGGYLPLKKVYSYNPVPASLTAEQAKLVYGVQGNLWVEYIPTPEHVEYMIYPRILALAETAWSAPERKSWPDFHTRALSAVADLQAKGYHPFDLKKEIGSRPESLQSVSHLALGKKVIYNSPYSSHYPAQGNTALTDGIRGDWTYGDGSWQGFISDNRLDVTIDMEKETSIHSVTAAFMQVVGAEVFLPETVVISISDDGTHFTELRKQHFEVSKETPIRFTDISWQGEAKGRYVRYQAQAGSEFGGWIFTDEIIVK
mgnify:CR=1 FL=1